MGSASSAARCGDASSSARSMAASTSSKPPRRSDTTGRVHSTTSSCSASATPGTAAESCSRPSGPQRGPHGVARVARRATGQHGEGEGAEGEHVEGHPVGLLVGERLRCLVEACRIVGQQLDVAGRRRRQPQAGAAGGRGPRCGVVRAGGEGEVGEQHLPPGLVVAARAGPARCPATGRGG